MGNCQDDPNSLTHLDAEDAQAHLMNHWKNLPSNDKRRTFEQQLNKVNVNQVLKIYKKSSRASTSRSTSLASSTESQRTSGVIDHKPIPENLTMRKQELLAQKEELDRIGKQSIKNGQGNNPLLSIVAVFIMSGFDYPQLNIDIPLGIYDIGLDSACTLFEILIARLIRLNILSDVSSEGKRIKVYIMTNTENKNQIKEYFKGKNYFGYGANNVFFFSQPVEAVLDQNGKIVLKSEDKIFMSARGTGAIYSEIKDKNLTQHLQAQGIKYVYFCSINNLLLKISDPCSLGYLIKQKKQVVAMCIESKDEGIGYFGMGNKNEIKVHEDRNQHGNCKWANTGACFMTADFLREVVMNGEFMRQMAENYHDVVRLATVFNTSLNTKTTQKCLFFQNFYHEAFSLTKKMSLVEIQPESQFAPIQNSNGKYSLAYAKQMLWKRHKKMLTDAGIKIIGEGQLQIHPVLTYEGQDIDNILKQKHIKESIKVPALIQ